MTGTPGEDWYQVNEIFHAPQGEGYFTGEMSTFIRLQGCIVGCEWCDTKYTWYRGGQRMYVKDIADQVKYSHVVITGGEPTQWDLYALVKGIKRNHPKSFIQLETSGLGQKPLPALDWITCSPKENLNFIVSLNKIPDEFKFVVDDSFDIDIALRLQKQYRTLVERHEFLDIKWYLQPEGEPPSQEHIDKTLAYVEKHPEFRFGGRLHTWINTR